MTVTKVLKVLDYYYDGLACVTLICFDVIKFHYLIQVSSVFSHVCMSQYVQLVSCHIRCKAAYLASSKRLHLSPV